MAVVHRDCREFSGRAGRGTAQVMVGKANKFMRDLNYEALKEKDHD